MARKWTPEELQTAKRMRESGASFSQIGEKLGRSLFSVASKLRKESISPSDMTSYHQVPDIEARVAYYRDRADLGLPLFDETPFKRDQNESE